MAPGAKPLPLNFGVMAFLVPNSILLTWHHFWSLAPKVWHHDSLCSYTSVICWLLGSNDFPVELTKFHVESTLIESKKDEDEAKAEEKDAPETKEVNASRQEVLLNSKQKKSENKRRKKPSKSAAMKEDVPNHFKFDYKGKQLINTMDLLRMKMTTRMVMEVGCKSAIMEVGFKGAIMEVNCKPVM
ncbi:hypothetical protein Tco_1305479, partial [Tanacetum coccineum]